MLSLQRFEHFRNGDLPLEDEQRPGCPTEIDLINESNKESDPTLTTREVASKLRRTHVTLSTRFVSDHDLGHENVDSSVDSSQQL